MMVLRIEHPVPDFDAWKRAFDADPVGRAGGGVRRHQVLRSRDDPRRVAVDLAFDDPAAAEAFRGALRALWGQVEGTVMSDGRAEIWDSVERRAYGGRGADDVEADGVGADGVDAAAMARLIAAGFPDVETTESHGYTFFFHGAERRRPFATLVAADNAHDRISRLDRPGVYRLNLGVGRERFDALFGPDKRAVAAFDYSALDTLMPHPDYAAQWWICVLNPGAATLASVRDLLGEAYARAAQRTGRGAGGGEGSGGA